MDTDSPNGPMLHVQGLHCGYGRAEVLHGIDLTVRKGEIACLIGANGAGKTTTIRAILGLVKPSRGSIRFRGEDLAAIDTAGRIERGIALVPEGRGVLKTLSVQDNLHMGAYVRRRQAGMDEDLDRVLAMFPILAERRQQLSGTLSGGEQQMLVIGRALMSRPKLLILDEPSFGLAPKIVDTIFETIVGLRETGLTILLVEQNAHIALQVSQHGFVLDSGSCLMAADSGTLRDDKLVRDIYLGAA